MAEGAAAVLGVARLLLLGLRRPDALPASFQEVSQHLTFALHADLAAAHKVVVVGDEAMDVLRHLEGKHRRMMFFSECVNKCNSILVNTLNWFLESCFNCADLFYYFLFIILSFFLS